MAQLFLSVLVSLRFQNLKVMNTKFLVVICASVFLVGATVFMMVTLTVNRDDPEREDLSHDMSLKLNTTESEVNSTDTESMGTPKDMPITPFLVIDAPTPCKPSEKYVAAKNKCEKVL